MCLPLAQVVPSQTGLSVSQHHKHSEGVHTAEGEGEGGEGGEGRGSVK